MIWSIIVVLIVLLIWQSVILKKQSTAVSGFELLLTRFIEINQEFYEGQKNIAKKDKEIFENLIKQTSEMSTLRRYSTQIGTGVRNTTEAVKLLKESQRDIKTSSDELKVSKDIANALGTISNNIKILDKVAMNLKQSIDNLKKKS